MDIRVDAAAVLTAEIIGLAAKVAVLAADGVCGIRAGALEDLLWADRCRVSATLRVARVEGGRHGGRVKHHDIAIVECEFFKQRLVGSRGGGEGALRDECEEQIAELHVDGGRRNFLLESLRR